MSVIRVEKSHYEKFVDLLGHGLVSGLGVQEPGKMCIEAAWCCALGLPHGDDPGCVGAAVRAYKIRLNDARWSSNAARAKGMLRLGIAQIGSDTLDQNEFRHRLVETLIRRIVPIALRAAASRNPAHADALNDAALRCEQEGTCAAAIAARDVARKAAAADAAAYAAYADAAAAVAAAVAAAYAADAAADAAADDADAAAYAADAAADAAYAAVNRDEVLCVAAEMALEILIDMKSPGCEYLYMADQ